MTPPDAIQLLTPEWPAPVNVRAVISTRIGGCSRGPFSGANLGDHVGDDPLVVAANRKRLIQQTGAHSWPWVKQVHGTELLQLEAGDYPCGQVADGVFSRAVGAACAVLTADCLPVLFCNRRGTQVAAVHAGWRGLAAGILERTLACFDESGEDVLAYLGPAIGPAHFEVGLDVYQAYEALFAGLGFRGNWQECFRPNPLNPGRFLADLYGLARLALGCGGVHHVYGGQHCTFAESESFFSYRRDGVTGRMVSAIWLV